MPARATAVTIDASELLDDAEVDGLTRSEPPPFCAPRGRALMVKLMAGASALVILMVTLMFATGSTKGATRYAAAALSMGGPSNASTEQPHVLGLGVAKGLSAKVGKHTARPAEKSQPKAKPRAAARPSSKASAKLAMTKAKPKAKQPIAPAMQV